MKERSCASASRSRSKTTSTASRSRPPVSPNSPGAGTTWSSRPAPARIGDLRRRLQVCGRRGHLRRRTRLGTRRPASEGQGAHRAGVCADAPRPTLFTYLHLAARTGTDAPSLPVPRRSRTNRADGDGALPLLAPMSEVAGRLAAQVGAYHLMKPAGGRGVLMGVYRVWDGPTSSSLAAARPATTPRESQGHGRSRHRLRPQHRHAPRDRRRVRRRIQTRYSSAPGSGGAVKRADLVIGAVLVPARRRPSWCRILSRLTYEAGRSAGGHRDRPGRLLRGLAAHHTR